MSEQVKNMLNELSSYVPCLEFMSYDSASLYLLESLYAAYKGHEHRFDVEIDEVIHDLEEYVLPLRYMSEEKAIEYLIGVIYSNYTKVLKKRSDQSI